MTELLIDTPSRIVHQKIVMPNGKTFRNQFIEVVPEGSEWVVSCEDKEIRIPFTGVHSDINAVNLAVDSLL